MAPTHLFGTLISPEQCHRHRMLQPKVWSSRGGNPWKLLQCRMPFTFSALECTVLPKTVQI